PLPLPALAAEAGGVDQLERAAVALEHGVDCVAGRAGHVGDDRPLDPDQRVEERRLADVGAAEDGNTYGVVAEVRPAGADLLEHRDDLVEQVAAADAVERREREGAAESEPMELERERLLRRVVDLVRDDEHRLA